MRRPTKVEWLTLPRARCHYEPRGAHGLEGYGSGRHYRYQEVQQDKNQTYFRVWPADTYDYFEVCSAKAFRRYFTTEKVNGLQ